ncbi:MAG: hypothetical protein MJ244_04110 [Clostridia bacterium]|nr:hypothetical protein [Clostridia bacterium]
MINLTTIFSKDKIKIDKRYEISFDKLSDMFNNNELLKNYYKWTNKEGKIYLIKEFDSIKIHIFNTNKSLLDKYINNLKETGFVVDEEDDSYYYKEDDDKKFVFSKIETVIEDNHIELTYFVDDIDDIEG